MLNSTMVDDDGRYLPSGRTKPFKIDLTTSKTVLVFLNDVSTLVMMDGYVDLISFDEAGTVPKELWRANAGDVVPSTLTL